MESKIIPSCNNIAHIKYDCFFLKKYSTADEPYFTRIEIQILIDTFFNFSIDFDTIEVGDGWHDFYFPMEEFLPHKDEILFLLKLKLGELILDHDD